MEDTKDKLINLSNEFINQYYEAIPTQEMKLKKEFNKIIHKLKMHVGHEVIEETELPPEKKSIRGRPKKLEETPKQYDKEYFQKYYLKNLKCEIQCDRCDRFITKTNMSRHKKSPYCIAYNVKEETEV